MFKSQFAKIIITALVYGAAIAISKRIWSS
jgi:hypothetical protein